MIARNLLGRLNARTPDDLQRIAAFWQVPAPGADRGRQIGALYRAMTDVRHARDVWERLAEADREIVRELSLRELGGSTIDDIADLTGLRVSTAREAAIRLFHGGVLAREGDSQELPIGALPRLFLPREVGGVFRKVQDEIDAGDLSGNSLRVILETLDEPELEEAATTWGVRVFPGQRRRADLIQQIVRQVDQPDRVASIASSRTSLADAIWTMVRGSHPTPVPVANAIERAIADRGTSNRDPIRIAASARSALAELESSLLVIHTYRRDGSRWLFVPHDIAHSGESPRTLPLQPLQPLDDEQVTPSPTIPRDAIAWDLLTLLREVTTHGSPLWVPGEPVSRGWQRRLNRRLWFGGDDMPPAGYVGFLLHLATSVGVLTASDQPLPPGSDRNAVRLIGTRDIRTWTRIGFADQATRLRESWLGSDVWLEGREREEIDIWGADWSGFRRRLVEAVGSLDPGQWVPVSGLALRLAEQQTDILGGTFTAASARATPPGIDERTASIAQAIEIELATALTWFGTVQSGRAHPAGLAVRGGSALSDSTRVEAPGPVLTLTDDGEITLLQPAPIHVWSLSAFADAEDLRPQATFRLRQASVGRALGNGFDLDQIVRYLEQQSGHQLASSLRHRLRDWTIGYRRVRLQRAVFLTPDTPDHVEDLRQALMEGGFDVRPGDDGKVIVMVPETRDGRNPEDVLLAVLRANGFAGQWADTGEPGGGSSQP